MWTEITFVLSRITRLTDGQLVDGRTDRQTALRSPIPRCIQGSAVESGDAGSLQCIHSVASIGLVSPGAATDGCHPKKLTTFLSHHCLSVLQCHSYLFISAYLISHEKLTTFFPSSLSLLLVSLGCHHLEGVTPHLFLRVPPRLSTVLCKFTHKKFSFCCHSPRRVSPGAVPLSDATVFTKYKTVVTREIKKIKPFFELPARHHGTPATV